VTDNFTPVQNILTREQRAAMLDGHAAGIPVKQIAAKFTVSRDTVWKHASKAGLVARTVKLDTDEAPGRRACIWMGSRLMMLIELLG
jgi:hypothetical protein